MLLGLIVLIINLVINFNYGIRSASCEFLDFFQDITKITEALLTLFDDGKLQETCFSSFLSEFVKSLVRKTFLL